MTERSAHRIAGDSLLADGEWHYRNDVRDEIARRVPPGKAVRTRRSMLEVSRSGHSPQTERHRTLEVEAAVGARQLANQMICTLVKKGVWERDGDRIRRRPD